MNGGFSTKITWAFLLFKSRKTRISYILLIDKGVQGTAVNLALTSMHGRSFEITLTVPLIKSVVFIRRLDEQSAQAGK